MRVGDLRGVASQTIDQSTGARQQRISTFFSFFIPLLVLTWRVGFHPAAGLWNDWMVIACGYWFISMFLRDEQHLTVITVLMVAVMLALYVSRQYPLSVLAFILR